WIKRPDAGREGHRFDSVILHNKSRLAEMQVFFFYQLARARIGSTPALCWQKSIILHHVLQNIKTFFIKKHKVTKENLPFIT
ncbi:hypothetical protein, partial [Mongoliibacter ruber]|uniref:hypothetical protein n=1 Tax=Mongoliibacter ruber TaxID=1750599 RepID=UPI001B80378A